MQGSHAFDLGHVLREFAVDPVQGLSGSLRRQSLRIHGRNQIPPPSSKSLLSLILKQFADLLVLMLLVAASVSFLLAIFAGENGITSFIEPIVILLILVANAVVGIYQERNADIAIAALKDLQAENAKVVIDGQLCLLPADEIVPGDIVHIDTGDKIPADLRLISVSNSVLTVDESSLTGESEPIIKTTSVVPKRDAIDQDKSNILFSSTLVTKGHGVGVAVLTGSKTSIGLIQAGIIESEDEMTPLQGKLQEFGAMLSKMILAICILVWLINIGHFMDPEYGGFLGGAVYFFKMAVSLAVAAIPEGLPAVVTTCLALGTRLLARKHAVVRRLASIETLGCTSVICSDKTGTLTSNKMTVRAVMSIRPSDSSMVTYEPELYKITGEGWSPSGQVLIATGRILSEPSQSHPALSVLGQISTLCNQAVINFNPLTRMYSKVGESTEAALKVLAEKLGTPDSSQLMTAPLHNRAYRYWSSRTPVESYLDFDRDRKSMSVIVTDDDSYRELFVKGAPENILDRCRSVLLWSGVTVDLTVQLRQVIERQMHSWGLEGLRCLAMASKELPSSFDLADHPDFVTVEQDLCFVGMVAMLDPPRPTVSDAIKRCCSAGIRPIVVTGDNIVTAKSICLNIGIFKSDLDAANHCITGAEFSSMTPSQQAGCVNTCQLFSRVEPMHKQMLVELLKSQGHVVAMTGDGVNDAPALRRADIGIAMGSGTAVARDACDMVLQNDDFATIVDAVEQGRSIFNNTRAFIRYLISSNIGEVVCVFLVSLFGIPEALLPVQLLWVNLVTDGLPAIALGFNPPDKDVMTEQPRSKNEPIVSSWHLFRFIAIGLYIGMATVFGFIWWFTLSPMGPGISFYQLRSFHLCPTDPDRFPNVDCGIFYDKTGATFALSILVTIEMLNALNALSQNQSLLVVTPSSNIHVVNAIVFSMLLHLTILYIPLMAIIFSVAPLSAMDWRYVFLFSFPVIVVDEILKLCSRNRHWFLSLPWLNFDLRSRRYHRFSDVEVRSHESVSLDSAPSVGKWA